MKSLIRYGAARRFARWTGLDRNPLRRGSDRVESAVHLVSSVLLLGSLVAGALLGLRLYDHGARTAAAARAALHQVTAVTGGEAPDTLYADHAAVPVRWTYRGVAHTGTIDVADGIPAGSTEPIWVDAAGRLRPPPLTDSQIGGDAVFTALGVPFAAVLLLVSADLVITALLNRRRAARWAAEWELTGPAWARRFRHR